MLPEEKRRTSNKLYSGYLRKREFNFYFASLFFLIITAGIIFFILVVWKAAGKSLEISFLDNKTYLQIIFSVVSGIFETLMGKNIYKRYGNYQVLMNEKKEYRGRIPDQPTNSVKDLYLSSFLLKNNIYWMVFAFIGFCIIGVLYSIIGAGIWKAVGNNAEPCMFKPDTWSSFKFSSFFGDAPTGIATGCILAIPAAFLIYFLFLLRSNFVISNLESIYGKGEITDLTYLEFKTHKNNKRNKIYTFIFLCILGFVIYVIFKKIIHAVFNKSFH